MSKFFPGLLALLLLFASWGAGRICHRWADRFLTSYSPRQARGNSPIRFRFRLRCCVQALPRVWSRNTQELCCRFSFRKVARCIVKQRPPTILNPPRLVLAVEAQPLTLPREAGLSLPRKFYVTYQERTEQLEIISYNDAAGRFEFQVVSDYAAGKTPVVRYANRVLCMSCHQNAGPIFATTPWRETNFDMGIAMRLAEEQPARYPSATAALGGHDAALLDYSTDRANYFSAYQLLWQQACGGENPNNEAAVLCRAGVLKALLQFRLSGDIAYDISSTRYGDTLRAFYGNWHTNWPGGLLVATADIPDRSPLEPDTGDPTLDALLQRLPQAFWPDPIDMVAGGMVTRLAEFIIDADIARYDTYLQRMGTDSTRTIHESSCDIQPTSPQLSNAPVMFNCGDSQSVNAHIEVVIDDSQVVGGHVLELHLPGDTYLWSATSKETTLDTQLGHTTLEAVLGNSSKFHPRIDDGRRLESISLTWEGSELTRDLIGSQAHVSFTIVDDFSPIENAIEAMVRETLSGRSDALSAKPFRRQAVVSDLNRHLGMPALKWCCNLPPVSGDQLQTPKTITTDALQDFQTNCGTCHNTENRYPPGFLYGSNTEVEMRLSDCAPRIFRRLDLWRQPRELWARSPMPPSSALALIGHDENTWASSDTLATLAGSIRSLIEKEAGKQAISVLLEVDYDTLPPCTTH